MEGRPFVDPGGRMFDSALDEAGIDRRDAYVANLVKHFKWEPRGKRRLQGAGRVREVRACLPRLDKEIELIEPLVLVVLGSTAARVARQRLRVSRQRGEFIESDLAPLVAATVHASSVASRDQSDQSAAASRVAPARG